MTLIAAFSVEERPVLFGDLLMTGPTFPSSPESVKVPAVGDVADFFEDSGWSISGLRQKIALISRTCVIAWAGSMISASSVITQLRSMAQRDALTVESILAYLEGDDDLKQHPLSIVGWICGSHERSFKCFWFRASEVTRTQHLGTIAAAGSGYLAIREFAAYMLGSTWKTTGTVGADEAALVAPAALAGTLVQSELRGGVSAPTLLTMFGGGYETAVYAGDRFQKMGDITYIMWDAHVDNDSVHISRPLFFLKQQYVSDVLLLRSARLLGLKGDRLETEEQRHAVMPVYPTFAGTTPPQLGQVSLQSSRFCHCFSVHGGPRPLAYVYVEQTEPGGTQAVTIRDLDGEIQCQIRQEFLQTICAGIGEPFRHP